MESKSKKQKKYKPVKEQEPKSKKQKKSTGIKLKGQDTLVRDATYSRNLQAERIKKLVKIAKEHIKHNIEKIKEELHLVVKLIKFIRTGLINMVKH